MTSKVIENKKPGYILRISQNSCANDQTNTMIVSVILFTFKMSINENFILPYLHF